MASGRCLGRDPVSGPRRRDRIRSFVVRSSSRCRRIRHRPRRTGASYVVLSYLTPWQGRDVNQNDVKAESAGIGASCIRHCGRDQRALSASGSGTVFSRRVRGRAEILPNRVDWAKYGSCGDMTERRWPSATAARGETRFCIPCSKVRACGCSPATVRDSEPMKGSALLIKDDDPAAAAALFAALSEGGQVTAPFREQFCGDHYGNFTDRFGVQWAVNSSPK